MDLSFRGLCSPRFPSVLINMICEWWSLWSFHHTSLSTLEVSHLIFNGLFSQRFQRVLIYMIWGSLRSFYHSCSSTLVVLDLSLNDLSSPLFQGFDLILYVPGIIKKKKLSLICQLCLVCLVCWVGDVCQISIQTIPLLY